MNSTKAACRIKNDTKLGRIMQVDWYIGETLIKLRAVEVDENEELIIPTTPIEGSIYLVEINSSLKAAVKHIAYGGPRRQLVRWSTAAVR